MEGGAWPDLSEKAGRRRKYEESGHRTTLSLHACSVNV